MNPSEPDANTTASTNEVLVCLRIDDYWTTTPVDVVRELAAILERHDARCLFGVIPFNETVSSDGTPSLEPLSGPTVDLLRELVGRGTVIPAVHGFVHKRTDAGLEEFAAGDVAEQTAKIRRGKALIEGIVGCPVTAFVPPWNVVSDATEEALRELGFDYVSTAVAVENTSRWDLIDVPSTGFWSAQDGVLAGLQHLDSGPIVVFTGHFFDFHDQDTGAVKHDQLERFERVLVWLKSHNRVRVAGMDEVAGLCSRNRAGWRRVTRSRSAFGLPYRFRRSVHWPGWLPTKGLSMDLVRIQLAGLALWASIVLLFLVSSLTLTTVLAVPAAGWVRLSAFLAGVLLVIYVAAARFPRQSTRAACLAVAGSFLGVAVAGFLGH